MSDPDRLSPEVLANLRAIRAGEPWPCPEIAVPSFAAISPTDFAPGSTWMLTPDGVAVLALADERDAIKAEMADLLKPAVDIDLRGALANVRALRALLGIPAAERTTGERADIEALYADMTEAMGMVLSEIPRLRAAIRLADEQSAEAIKRVSSEILADKWNSTADLQQKVKALTTDLKHVEHALGDRIKPGQTLERVIADLIADLDRAGAEVGRWAAQFEETRLTLLAEQGKPEGAPPGWSYEAGDPDFDEPGEWVNEALGLKVWKSGTGWVWLRRIANGAFVGPKGQDDGQPARIVMLAATAAVK